MLKPRLVERLLRYPVDALACRGSHVLALTAKGQVWSMYALLLSHAPSSAHAPQELCVSIGFGLHIPQATGQSRTMLTALLSQCPKRALG